jgi:3-isopropylmalate/(R)-2-methylmalate dehydratase small subunit
MEAFTVLEGVAAPLLRQNIDTDVVIRINRLRDLQKDELGPYAFEAWRYLPDGSESSDFVLNQPPYREAKILLAGNNFACGSSREGAVWALWGFGLRCVIAPSFGPIFFNNCFQNGMLPIILPAAEIRAIVDEIEASPSQSRMTVDLRNREIVTPHGRRVSFSVDGLRRDALLAGQDEIERTLQREGEINAYQARDRRQRPWIYAAG